MATTTPCISTTLIDGKAPLRQSAAATSAAQCVSLPTLPSPSLQQPNRIWKATGYCRKLARNVAAMATAGEASTDQVDSIDVQELIKPIQEAAIDRLPLIPGVLELVGIGYTGWFAYKNLVFKPDREALLEKIKCTYEDIIGSG